MNIYHQRDPRYKGIKLGNSNLSFQSYGCFTCCLAYMVQQDPLIVMEKLKKNGGYNGALIKSSASAKILKLDYHGKDSNINNMPSWSPSIKEVTLGKSQHFVVRLIRNGKRLIYDPWLGKEMPINHYPFKSYRLFKNQIKQEIPTYNVGSQIELWAEATKKHEGWFTTSRSQRNNNPGNLRYSGYTASLGENKGKDDKNFIIYKDYETGFNALKQFLVDAASDKLRSYKRDMTLLQFYQVYAPSADGNSPKNYATFVANQLKVNINTKIKTLL